MERPARDHAGPHPALPTKARWWRAPQTLVLAGLIVSAMISLWALVSARNFRPSITLNAREAVNQRVDADCPAQGPNDWHTLIEATDLWASINDRIARHTDRMADLNLLYPGQLEWTHYGSVEFDALLRPPARLPPERRLDEPYPTSPNDGLTISERLDADTAARELYAQQVLSRLTIREAERQGLDELLDRIAAAPRLVRTFEGEGPLVEVLMPELSHMRRMALMERVRMRLAYTDGRPLDALRHFEHALALGRAAMFQATLIDRLVAVAIYEMALDELGIWLSDAPPDGATLARLESILREQASIAPHSTWIATERLFAQDILQRVYTDDGEGDGFFVVAEFEWLDDLTSPNSGLTLDSRWLNAFGAFMPSRRQTQAAFDTYYDNLEASVGRTASVAPDSEDLLVSMENPFVKLLAPAVSRAISNIDATAQHIAQMRIELALQAYAARHARYPQDLDGLIGDGVLDQVPTDPLSGRPFAYQSPATPGGGRDSYVLAPPSPMPATGSAAEAGEPATRPTP